MTIVSPTPADGATDVARNVTITFVENYAFMLADELDLAVRFDGGAWIDVVIDGVFQTGYSGSVTTLTPGNVAVSVDPSTDLPANTLVEWVCMLEDNYSFTTGESGTTPEIPLSRYGEP